MKRVGEGSQSRGGSSQRVITSSEEMLTKVGSQEWTVVCQCGHRWSEEFGKLYRGPGKAMGGPCPKCGVESGYLKPPKLKANQ